IMPIFILSFIQNSFKDFLIYYLAIFLITNYVYAIIILLFEQSNKSLSYFLALVIFPFYFIMHSIAAYYALYELCVAPFRWNKTDHNIL
ncbi:MAG: hypothetical protein SFT68_03335, partial [Rickettsiaceae bacterium]|nr:hypothetical protein [Rickettsiaceae bacterium]